MIRCSLSDAIGHAHNYVLQSARSAKLAGEKFKTAEGPTVTSITESLKKLKIGVERQAYHGGSFIGNNVQKCLKVLRGS